MNQAATATRSPAPQAIGSLDLNKTDTILVKFFFTNQDHVPRGVPHINSRTSSYALDFSHAQQAKNANKAELGALGRHRENRVDTGEPIIENLPGVQATLLKEDLLKAGYALKNLHWTENRKPGRPVKYVVVCEFVRGRQTQVLPPEALEALDFLSHTAVWFCHVWDNSALDKPATINFVGRDPRGKAQYYLMVVGTDTITGIPVRR